MMSVLNPAPNSEGLQEFTYIIWSSPGAPNLQIIQHNFASALNDSNLPFLIEDPNGTRGEQPITDAPATVSNPISPNAANPNGVKAGQRAASAVADMR